MNFPGEIKAAKQCIENGLEYGFGNMISRMQYAWALELLKKFPDFSVYTAMRGALFDESHAKAMEAMGKEKAIKYAYDYSGMLKDE